MFLYRCDTEMYAVLPLADKMLVTQGSVIGLSCVNYAWNLHESSIFQTIQVCQKSFASLSLLITIFCMQSYPLTGSYRSYSCQCQYLIKCNIYTYCDIWPNQHRPHGPILGDNLSNLPVRGHEEEERVCRLKCELQFQCDVVHESSP